jgi:NTP pyrophosphatase (non-canonical NTP hydrolase)
MKPSNDPNVYRNCNNEDFATDVQFYNYDYPEFVAKACQVKGDKDRMLLAALGLCGEAGEVAEIIKKHVFHGKEIDHKKLMLEMGDVIWYFTLLMNERFFDLDSIMQANIDKLQARFGPDHGVRDTSPGCHVPGPGCHG